MIIAHPALRILLAHGLLGLSLALPPAAFAATSSSSLLPTSSPQSRPQSIAFDPNCLSIDGGDPAAAHPCGEQAPASQEDPDGVGHGAGNPIDVITGNKYQRETDLPALPGVLGIEIVRHYNSAQAGTGATLGLLGRGWRLSYETDLYAIGRQVHIVQADGTRLVFVADGQQPSHYRHADPARGWVQAIATGPDARAGGYRWIWPEGRELDFDGRGKLVQIRLPTGEFLSLTRGLDGELVKVTDPQGRSLSFEYAPRTHRGFRGVIAITSPLGRFSYAHQNERGLPGLSNLIAATHPDGSVWRYHYGADRGEAAPDWPHHLTGISFNAPTTAQGKGDAKGVADTRRHATYAYDRSGRAVMSVRGAPRALDEAGQPRPDTGVEQVDLEFVAPDRTVLTNSLGQRTTYRHTRLHGEPRLLEAIGPGCARCGETNVRYHYDDRGRRVRSTRLDPGGQPVAATSVERDHAGRVMRRAFQPFAGGKPLPERLLTRYEYADTSSRPVLIARPSIIAGREHRLRFAYNDAGQIIRVVEHGFSPLDAEGEPTDDPERAMPIERASSFSYTRINARSLLSTTDGPLPNGPRGAPDDSDVARFEWDARGNHLSALTLPGSLRSTFEQDPATGMLKAVRNGEGLATRYTYNLRLQRTSVSFEAPGQALPQTRHFEYDALGRPIQAHSPSSPASNWLQAWDEQGRLGWHASALGVLHRFRYDTEGRAIERSRRSASFEQTEFRHYDALGRLVSVRDNAGRGRQWYYDVRGRLHHAIDSDGLIHPLRTGNAPDAAQAGSALAVRQRRDDFGRIVWRHSRDSGSVRYEYDALDRLVAMRDARGNRARYDYDPRSRIARQRISDAASGASEETQWRYDGARLVELVHPTQRERYEYDARGRRSARIVTLPNTRGELTAVTRYEHDEHGQLIATTLPDGSRLRYVRNGQGQVVALRRDRGRSLWPGQHADEQLIAEGFERDLAGLRSYRSGNGIHTRYLRSREGVLAQIVHRRIVRQGAETTATSPMELLGRSARELAERLLGIAPAHAQGRLPYPEAVAGPSAQHTHSMPLPGALGLADDPAALLDHRYLWDMRGNLLHTFQRAATDGAQPTASGHAYDRHGRLLSAVRWQSGAHAPAAETVWRFAYDTTQRRVLSQQGARSQHELQAGTQTGHFEPGTHRRTSPSGPVRYSASGQPERWGDRDYEWDARGRLIEVREQGAVLARYRYDHRGLRNTRQLGDRTLHTLYDEHRQPLAELDADGRILRQYVWLADLPLAVIDTPQGVAPATHEGTVSAHLTDTLSRLLRAAFTQEERIVWLHGNHLGAPELATDAEGRALWRATYAPFGAATIQSRDFSLDLRLPGQVFDAETGLHYNRARYYDPEAGQYLTPDPLGTPDGPNPYAYVAFNPLRNVDPEGLILFAFDGTANSSDERERERLGGSDTNVVRFLRLYVDGPANYVSGVGSRHYEDGRTNYLREAYEDILPKGLGPVPDSGGNFTGRARIERMWEYFIDEAEAMDDENVMDIDITGFSRGASQARDFANRLADALVEHEGQAMIRYSAIDPNTRRDITRCQPVNLRFIGLFDTVLSTDLSFSADYRLSIPGAFSHVAHAVALNEYRSQPIGWDVGGYLSNAAFWNATRRNLDENLHQGGFPLESIGAGSQGPGQVRIERGFIGAHADIGGGYEQGENQLSFVALNWMVKQARLAGVTVRLSGLDSIPTTNPIIHDQSNSLRIGHPDNPERHHVSREVPEGDITRTEWELLRAEDREVRGAASGTTQRTMGFTAFGAADQSMTNADTHQYISYFDRPVSNDPDDTWNVLTGNQTGTVDIAGYMAWLKANGYSFIDQ